VSGKQIRIAQLIAPFGPGSLYTDRRGIPHVICGLDNWFLRYDQANGFLECDDIGEFQKFEPRLAALLRVDQFRSPPDYRAVRRGATAPPNALLTVPALRFPSWYRNTKTGRLKKFNLDTSRLPGAEGGGRWQPVRFISVCAGGHMNEFPWKEWIGCDCVEDDGLELIDLGGSELSSIRVRCKKCPDGSSGHRGRTLAGTTARSNPAEQRKSEFEKAGIRCPGERPWLGEDCTEHSCPHPLSAALINQTNLYFPRTVSAILLPAFDEADEETARLRNEINGDPKCGTAKTLWRMGDRESAVAIIQKSLSNRHIEASSDIVENLLEGIFENAAIQIESDAKPVVPESELLAFRRSEFNILRRGINDPVRFPDLRVIETAVPKDLKPWLSRVNLIERLRETRVFYGFDRLEQQSDPISNMPESAMKQLFRQPPDDRLMMWLPAIETFGEGIYFELDEKRVDEWQRTNSAWLKDRLEDRFLSRLYGVYQTLPPKGGIDRNWASRYLLVHSLSHVLINQLVFECGYSTASLRERLFVSADPGAPMAASMIYTASGDSEGTMGGLVRLGRSEALCPMISRALARTSWCSADPVCSENLGGQGTQQANLAACHACILLPETSCETINHGLDRAMVIGTPENRAAGFMADLIKEYAYE
jgi:hypothetical protein